MTSATDHETKKLGRLKKDELVAQVLELRLEVVGAESRIEELEARQGNPSFVGLVGLKVVDLAAQLEAPTKRTALDIALAETLARLLDFPADDKVAPIAKQLDVVIARINQAVEQAAADAKPKRGGLSVITGAG